MKHKQLNIMTKQRIFELVRENVAETIGIDEDEVLLDSHFFNDLGCDSLMLSELILNLEDGFGVLIPDADAENLTTIQSVVDYIKKTVP